MPRADCCRASNVVESTTHVGRSNGTSRPRPLAALGCFDGGRTCFSQVSFTDINPNQSTLHPSDPDGASGGRVNGLASVERDPNTYYAATEWGGILIDGPRPDLGSAGWPSAGSHVGCRGLAAATPNRHRELVLRRPRRQPGGDQREQRWRRDLDKAGHQHSTRRFLCARTPRRAVCVWHRRRPTQS